MGDMEEYFPRGGKKPASKQLKQGGNFLGVTEQSVKKKKPKKKSEGDDGYLSDDIFASQSKEQNTLIYLNVKNLKPGMNLLARVIQVSDVKVKVSMPCRLVGYIMACHISEPYNKLLEAYVDDKTEQVCELSEMFKPGQYVAVSVVEVCPGNTMLSTMPQHIYNGKRHTDIQKGFIFQGAVLSVEDHGYVIDVGMPEVKAFLNKSDANPEINLDVGMITWCAVKSVKSSAESAVLALASTLEALQAATVMRKPGSQLTPATPVQFTVDCAADNGIKGFIFNEQPAGILQQHSDKVKDRRPAVGQKVKARVVFVMPTKNLPYLTLKNIFETTYPDLQEEKKYNDGDIIDEAQVLKIIGRSVHLKLGRNSIGVISIKTIDIEEELTDEEVIAKSYPIGSTHRVRVLNYNLCDYLYTVTDEPTVLNEKYFTMEQLSVGEIVNGTVMTVTDGYVLVSVGRMHGYVTLSHLTDGGVLTDPLQRSNPRLTQKFKVGQQVRARVLSVNPLKPSLLLTLKPTLVSPAVEALQSHQQAVVGKAYTGVISAIREYILVSFFNDLIAYVPRAMISKTPISNLREAFHIGQIATCTIISVDPKTKKLFASFITEPFRNNNKRKKGDRHTSIGEIGHQYKKRKDSHEETDNEEDKQTEDEHAKGAAKSDESDAIDTDLSEDSDQGLTADDWKMLNVECVSKSQHRRRIKHIYNIVKDVQAIILVIDEKIAKIEEKGLTPKNKTTHNTLLSEKFIGEERIRKLTEHAKKLQEKLSAMRTPQDKTQENADKTEDNDSQKKDKKKKKKEKNSVAEQIIEDIKHKNKEADILTEEAETNSKNKKDSVDEKKKKDTVNEKKKNDKVDEKKKKDTVDEKYKKDTVDKKNKKDSIEEKKATEKQKKKEAEKQEEAKENKKKDKKKKESKNELQPVLDVPSVKEIWNNKDVSAEVKQDEESSSSDDEHTEEPKKKRKKLSVSEKLAKARAEEERLREMERRVVDSEAEPRSADHFQRALLANPNCSQLWIAYMAFHLQSTEIEKARAVARKALSTICFRDEDEKLNVWLALINLENRFGTKESQQKTLEESLQMNDTFKIHSKLLDIYVDTGKQHELSSLVDLMLRRYRRDPLTYSRCGAACYDLGLKEKARYVMQKGLSVLEKKEHVQILVQFALLERDHGSRERAEALLEQVLAVYSQRIDVCAVYVDMLAKERDVGRVRQVMERVTSHQLPARKMKVLFKKWIEVEERIGDQDRAELIRQRAVTYVEKAKF